MMEQYWSLKNSLPKDTLLLFRLGDFYEMFYDDAIEGSRLLGITLTKRQNYPMAGIPYHVIDQYLPKILACNKKVAICEQNEPPVAGKLVKRSVTRIITPGTVMEEAQLDSRRGNYILRSTLTNPASCTPRGWRLAPGNSIALNSTPRRISCPCCPLSTPRKFYFRNRRPASGPRIRLSRHGTRFLGAFSTPARSLCCTTSVLSLIGGGAGEGGAFGRGS